MCFCNGIDVRSHKLKSNIDVINEAQTIHLNIFKALIGKYRYAMLFGLAAFENKGDPAISVGEILLFQSLNIKVVFNRFFGNCGSKLLDRAQALSKDYSNKTLVILLQGGGNLLSYIVNDYLREEVLSRFRDFEAILFPESIWPRSSISIQKRFQKSYSEHPRLTFLYRDRESYNKGKALFPKVRALLVPDMAFEIGPVPRTMPPIHDILWLRRSDAESSKYIIPSNVKYYDVSIGDWLQWKTPKGDTEIETAYLITANAFMFLQRGRVVITDRLHGHILSTLLGIPHVVLDPVNNKTTAYMKSWTGGLMFLLLIHQRMP